MVLLIYVKKNSVFAVFALMQKITISKELSFYTALNETLRDPYNKNGPSHTKHLRDWRSVWSPIIKKEIIITLKEGVSAG